MFNVLTSSAFDLERSLTTDSRLCAVGMLYFATGHLLIELGDKFIPNPKAKLNLNYWVNVSYITNSISELLHLQNEWLFKDRTFKTVKACNLLNDICFALHNIVLLMNVSINDVLNSTLHWLQEDRGQQIEPVSQIAKLRKKYLNTTTWEGLVMRPGLKSIQNLTKMTK